MTELDDLLARAEPALAGYLTGKLRLAAPPGGGPGCTSPDTHPPHTSM